MGHLLPGFPALPGRAASSLGHVAAGAVDLEQRGAKAQWWLPRASQPHRTAMVWVGVRADHPLPFRETFHTKREEAVASTLAASQGKAAVKSAVVSD